MKQKDSDNFFVKIYLDDFDASDYLAKQCGYEVAYKFLKAKANLYFNDEDTCPDDPIAIGLWVSGVKRRTLADREHKQHVSQVRAEARIKTIDNKNNNCYQTEQLITNVTIDNKNNNCYQKEQLITNDTINRVNRERELIELNNSLSHTREEEEGSPTNTTSLLNSNPNSLLNNNPTTKTMTEGAGEARPTMEQVCEFAKTICCPDYLARKFFHHYEANGWVTDGENPRPFKWQPKLSEWKAKEDAKARERHADISSKKKINNINNINDEFNGI